MPFQKIKTFQNSFPQIKNLSRKQKRKALKIFNAMVDAGEPESQAIATAIKKVKQNKMSENLQEVSEQEVAEQVASQYEGVDPADAMEALDSFEGFEVEMPDLAGFIAEFYDASASEVQQGLDNLEGSDEEMDEELNLEDVSEKQFIDMIASFYDASVSDVASALEELGGTFSFAPRDFASFVAQAMDASTGDVLEFLANLDEKKADSDEEENMQEDYKYISELSEEKDGVSKVEVLRATTLHDRDMKITEEMLTKMEQNFKDGVYGIKDEEGNPQVAVNANHQDGEALGWVVDLQKEEDKLFATIEWTELGEKKLEKDLFKFVSAEFKKKFPHPDSGDLVENVFTGLALTNKPALKGQTPVELSEQINLQDNNNLMFQAFLDNLLGRDSVKNEDLNLLKTLFNRLSDEEKKKFQQDVEKVKSKGEKEEEDDEEEMEDEEEQDEEEQEESDDEDEEEDEEEEMQEKGDYVSMEEHEQLKEKLEKKELNEKFENELKLQEDSIGFQSNKKDDVVEFMLGLDEQDREEFINLVSCLKEVDTNTYGSTTKVTLEGDEDEKVAKLTEEILEEDDDLDPEDAKDVRKAQKKAVKQLN